MDIDEDIFFSGLEELKSIMYDDSSNVRRVVKRLVETYKEPNDDTPAVTFMKRADELLSESDETVATT